MAGNLLWSSSMTHDDDDDDRKSSIERDHITRFARNYNGDAANTTQDESVHQLAINVLSVNM